MIERGVLVGGRFRIFERIGRGGMGEVYRAEDLSNGGEVALKIQSSEYADPDRFLAEARALSALQHEAIVRYVAHGLIDSGAPFFAMEWIAGMDLGGLLQSRQCNVREALAVARRVGSALEAAHRGGVIHRDVKPPNVMLPGGEPSRAVLVDFGIARNTGASRALTRTGAMIGTVGYMASEQLHGARDIDARVDVFGLGCVLYECLAGQPAFTGDSLAAVLSRVLIDDAPHVREQAPHVSEALDALVYRMLARDRAERPADMGAVLRGIDAASRFERGADELKPSPLTPSVTLGWTRERVPAALILALPTDAHVAPDATLAAEGFAEVIASAEQVARRWGASSSMVVGAAILMGFTRGDRLRERVAGAARAALELRDALPGWFVSVTVSHAEGEKIPLPGELSRQAGGTDSGETSEGVRIDDTAAVMLDASFEVERGPHGYELRGYAPVREGETSVAGQGLPCVGREKELRLLDATLAECEDESSHRAVIILAPTGLGKSRLRREFVARARVSGSPRVLFARGEFGANLASLAVMRQWLIGAAGIGAEHGSSRRAALESYLRALGPRWPHEELFEFAAEIVGVAIDEKSTGLSKARSDPREMRQKLVAVTSAWLAAECERATVVLTVDDLQWADPLSIGLLVDAWKQLEDSKLFLVGTAWPEVEERYPALAALKGASVLRLEALGRKATERLVRAALGDRVNTGAIARVVEMAEGHPFLLEELVRHVAKGGGLDELPTSAVAVVQARLMALTPEARGFLRAASVFGESFAEAAVSALFRPGSASNASGSSDGRSLCERLVREEVLLPAESSASGAMYRFAHSLVRQAAYETLPLDERRAAHHAAAEWLRRQSGVDPAVLSVHLELAGALAEAAVQLDHASRQAYDRAEYELALRLALRGLPHAIDSATVGSLTKRQIYCHILRGQMAEAIAAFAILRTDRIRHGSPEWMALKLGEIGVLLHTGVTELPLQAIDEAMALTEWPAPTMDWAQTIGLLTATLVHLGDVDRVRTVMNAAQNQTLDAERDGAYLAVRDHYMAWGMAALDDPAMYRVVRSCLDNSRRCLARVALNENASPMPYLLAELGLFDEARALIDELRARLDPDDVSNLDWVLTSELALLSITEPTTDVSTRAATLRGRGWLVTEGFVTIQAIASRALSRPGDRDAASLALRELAEYEPALGPFQTYRAHLRGMMAEIALQAGDPSVAIENARKVLSGPDSMVPSCRTRARLVLVKALAALGEDVEAARELTAATERLLRFADGLPEPEVRAAFMRVPQVAETLALRLLP